MSTTDIINDETTLDEQIEEELESLEGPLDDGDEEELEENDLADEDVESEDSLTFSNGVIEKIVALGMRDVPGVVGMKGGFINRVQDAFGVRDTRRGVTVEVTPDSAVRVNLSVFIAYGSYAPQIFEDVKHAVVNAVTGMTGLEVAGVNLRIEDVLTPEEIEARMPRITAAPEPDALPEADEPEELEAPELEETAEELEEELEAAE